MATTLTVCSPRAPSSSAAAEQDCRRKYAPSVWGDFFINHQPCTPEELLSMQNKAQAKKEEVRRIVLDAAAAATSGDLVRKLELVDALQRLGVDYHYKEEIDALLRSVYEDHHVHGASASSDDLYVTSLRFYLLRKHGYAVSSDVFVRFRDEQGNVSSDDVPTLMMLYDAAHTRTHGEDILDNIISFNKSRLQTVMKSTNLDPDLAEEVRVTLETTRFRRAERVEARRFISVYEKAATRDDVILEFAKLDYNIVQAVYCKELEELTVWWQDLQSRVDLSFARDRLVEMYCWMMVIVYEPYYSRKMLTKMVLFFALLDDIYDNYSTTEESNFFTAAIERWGDENAAKKVPEHLRPFLKSVIRTTDEVVSELKRQNNKHAEVVREVVLHVVRSYHAEVKWRDEHYVPAGVGEHLQLSLDSIMGMQTIVLTLVTLGGDVTTRETIDSAFKLTKIVRAATVMARIMNDVMSHEREQASDHVASTVETCMKQYGVTVGEAIGKLTEIYEQAWMDIVEECLDQKFPRAVLDKVVNVGQSVDFIYKRDDSYTTPSSIRDTIASLYTKPV